ncbi:MAG: hypothetical protein NC833_02525 [Candidatus Omnitrophica bacterium]|nr:hypothetical protein [Candidatus Omnitrophota bacterium]
MKKVIIPALMTFLFFGFSQIKLNGQEKKEKERIQRQTEYRPIQEGMEIRRRIIEIERQIIENDPELKILDEQIKKLQKQLNDKLQEKLSTNTEYQELKQKMEQIHQQWEERMKHRHQQEED